MIDLYYWPTPNGWKISIALEEMALAYRMVPVNIGRGEQIAADELARAVARASPAGSTEYLFPIPEVFFRPIAQDISQLLEFA